MLAVSSLIGVRGNRILNVEQVGTTLPDESPHTDGPDPEPTPAGSGTNRNGIPSEIDAADLAALLDEVTQDDLSTLSPEDGVEMYLQVRKEELTASSLKTQKSRLGIFLDWCDEAEVTDLNDLRGRDLLQFRTWRSDDLSPSSLEANMRTLRSFLERCVNFDAVPPSLPEKVDIPAVDGENASRGEYVPSEQAERILDHLDQYEYATVEHVIWLLMTTAGLRLSAVRSIDVDDFSSTSDGGHLHLNHRPDSDTPLKNKSESERIVHLPEYVDQVLDDYVETNRPDVTDEYGRQPLVASEHGRVARTTIRKYGYKWTRPCVVDGTCPHGVPDEEIESCEARQSSSHAYKCPGSSSPHPIRRGYITHELNMGVPKAVISDRCDVSSEVIDEHYDERSDEERMELRTEIRNSTYKTEDESGYAQ